MFASGSEWLVVLIVVILLFGASAVPKIARSLGQAKKEFKKGMEEGEEKETENRK